MQVCFSKKKAVALTSAVTLCLIVMTVNKTSDDRHRANHHYVQVSQSRTGLKSTHTTSISSSSSGKEDDSDKPVIFNDGRTYIPRHRVVHLDLKGAPPKPSYLKALFPLLQEAGATAILIEYEDMFPYWGRLKNISARNAYSVREVEQIQKWASDNGMGVIPLVQTFGHLEHALKLEEFYDLREVPAYPQSLCPSKNASWSLVREMIDQVTSLHPTSTFLHIGCDEVYQLGMCPVCNEKLMQANSDGGSTILNDQSLFLQHVHRVGSYVKEQKGLVPIIWDDMLRKIPAEKLHESGIGSLGVEPMVWVYVEDIDRFVYSYTWSIYAEVFKNMWAASAFKGAFGEQLYVANVARHAYNHVSWLEVMRRETLGSNAVSFRGIVLTGWSRYDHFAVLCELLPAAVPSLVLNLAILTRGSHDREAAMRTHRILKCTASGAHAGLMTQQELVRNPEALGTASCRFPGAQVLSYISSYKNHDQLVRSALQRVNDNEGWMTKYNVMHSFSSPWRVRQTMQALGIGDYYLSGLINFKETFSQAMSVVYDKYTIQEWMEQHVDTLVQDVKDLMGRAKALIDKDIWPRRPLLPPPSPSYSKKKSRKNTLPLPRNIPSVSDVNRSN